MVLFEAKKDTESGEARVRYLLKEKLNNNAGWSSPVARRAHNPKVVGSNPAPATISLEVSNLEASSFLVFLGFSKDVQNGLILNCLIIRFCRILTKLMHNQFMNLLTIQIKILLFEK